MKNHNHDLIHQLSEDLDSLWRYKEYKRNAKGCRHCLHMWQRLEELDQAKVTLLREEIERHVKEKRFE